MTTTKNGLARPKPFPRPKRVRHAPNATIQPVDTVEWVDRSRLQGNIYNPNHVAPPELRLLKLSILEDGWTQPIVVRPLDDTDGGLLEIVDGFHRWHVSGDPEVLAMTQGMVPTVRLRPADEAHQRMSTIRHNRARGTHHVLKMADIVCDLIDVQKLAIPEVMARLEMEEEEVDRLYDRGNKLKRGSADGFNKGWIPGGHTGDR